jgi:hypothetical protein
MPTITTSQLDYWLHCVQSYLAECHEKFRKTRLDDLIKRHDLFQAQHHQKERRSGFVYNGLIWRTSVKPMEWFDHLLALDVIFQPEMDGILKEELDAQRDFHRIRQICLLAFHGCDCNQDIRDVVPECLLPAFKNNISNLSRTRETGFTLRESPAKFKQWQAAEERINYHCAMRLIYS